MKIPSLVSCCFCIPLRKGLLCLSYSKLLLCLIMLVLFMLTFIWSSSASALEGLLFFTPLVLDLGLALMFIVAAHKKNLKLFSIYYYYSIILVVVSFVTVLMTILDKNILYISQILMLVQLVWFTDIIGVYVGYNVQIFIVIMASLLQIYIALLVRSQVQELKELSKDELESQEVTEA